MFSSAPYSPMESVTGSVPITSKLLMIMGSFVLEGRRKRVFSLIFATAAVALM